MKISSIFVAFLENMNFKTAVSPVLPLIHLLCPIFLDLLEYGNVGKYNMNFVLELSVYLGKTAVLPVLPLITSLLLTLEWLKFCNSYIHCVAKVHEVLPFYDVKCLCSGGRE